MEKARKARMTKPPTVPPMIRIVVVLTPEEEEEALSAEGVPETREEERVDWVWGVVPVVRPGRAVGTELLVAVGDFA